MDSFLDSLGPYIQRRRIFSVGETRAFEFFTAYVLEKSLSIDNLFVFIMIFGFFKIPPKYQHKVLFWGIFGAIIMRAIFIFSGIALINKFAWIMYVFGAFLIYTGVKMFIKKEEKEDDFNPTTTFSFVNLENSFR